MSVFRRRREESPAPTDAETAAGATLVPAGRDPELGVPPMRPPGRAPVFSAMAPGEGYQNALPRALAGQGGNPPGPGPQWGGRAEGAERRTLVVGKGISLQGTVADAERLVVEGTVESQMIQASELAIARSGVFRGEVEVEDAEVAGVFDGTLTVRGSLLVRATGRVLGVARCRRLSVEEGGQVSGRIEMLADEPGAPAAGSPYARAVETAEG